MTDFLVCGVTFNENTLVAGAVYRLMSANTEQDAIDAFTDDWNNIQSGTIPEAYDPGNTLQAVSATPKIVI